MPSAATASAATATRDVRMTLLSLRFGHGWTDLETQPRREARPEDREQQQAAGDDGQDLVADVVERQRVSDGAEQEHGGDDGPQRALAAEDRHAAEEHDGDDRQLEAGAVVGARAREAERVDDARQRADQPADDEEPELDALHAQAAEVRGLLVGADGEDGAPERRAMQDEAEDHRQHGEEHDRVRDLRPREVAE